MRYFLIFVAVSACACVQASNLERIKYNNPGLIVDFGAGLWAQPVPVDWDNDGDNDLIICCADKPAKSIWLFENPQGPGKLPVFKPPVRLGPAYKNLQPSYVQGTLRLLDTNKELVDFKAAQFKKTVEIYPTAYIYKSPLAGTHYKNGIRANQWTYLDYDGNGSLDIIAAYEDVSFYGWDNAFDKSGNWTRGPLHGFIYVIPNSGTSEKPSYSVPFRIQAGGRDIDLYGRPAPSFRDFDNDGDLDIICGEFLDSFTYFQNIGTRTKPVYASGVKLTHNGQVIRMYVEMIAPVAYDFDDDGDFDLIVGDEDGRVAFVENTGRLTDSIPQFLPPRYLQQQADEVKFGALVTPFSIDWDDDGLEDILAGNTAGNIAFIKNLGGKGSPAWAAPQLLIVDGKPIHIMAGPNGSIQGPCECKWGYTILNVADWDHDGLKDIVVNSIWGKVIYYRNKGAKGTPVLDSPRPLTVKWSGKPQKPAWNWWDPNGSELVTQWRTTPFVIDLDKDGLCDLVMLDSEGYLAFFKRIRDNNELTLLPPKRIFKQRKKGTISENVLCLNSGSAGKSGRRTFCLTDWDLDGKLDLMLDSNSVNFYKNVSRSTDEYVFEDQGPVDEKVLAGHATCPTSVDWEKNGIPDLLIGAEDGFLYYLRNPHQR